MSGTGFLQTKSSKDLLRGERLGDDEKLKPSQFESLISSLIWCFFFQFPFIPGMLHMNKWLRLNVECRT